MLWPQDARFYQIGCLSLFLLLGLGTRDWTLHPSWIALVLLTCGLTQAVGCGLTCSSAPADTPVNTRANVLGDTPFGARFWQAYRHQLPSALITGLGLGLLLRADGPLTLILAASGAIASKFLLRYQGKHLFNPANFGIITALCLCPDAWVSPGQWGDESWYGLVFIGLGGLVLRKVGRWETSVVFLGSYAALEAGRNLWLGWTWDVWAHRMMSGSLLLFALFMLTDPRTLPNAKRGRVIWAMAVALLTFVLRNYFFNSSALIWALFSLAPLTLVIDGWLPAERFHWWLNPPMPQPVTEI
jgi:Na+-transporting NADH:ubiquinone oxidoreductase subunit NqrB